MTHPSDIAGLSERLRTTLGGIAREECLGDNLAILLASYFEPHIEDETLDECGNWKQGAIDACDKVLDAIHAHYTTALDSLTARVKELEAAYEAAFDRGLRAEQHRDEAYERAAKVADGYCGVNFPPQYQHAEIIAAAIRRLASGPEGGAKP